jgi:hypothetical protein
MTIPAGGHVGFAAICYDIRQWRMVFRVPDRRDESGAELGPGVTGRAVWHADKIAIVDWRLVVAIVLDIRPPRRRVSGRGGGGQRGTHHDRCKQSFSYFHLCPHGFGRQFTSRSPA